MRNYDIKLDEYQISRNAYRELKYFCLQYREKLERIKDISSGKAITYTGMPHATAPGNPTVRTAEKLEPLRQDIELIEQTAIEASAELYQYLIKNVGYGIPYELLCVPCGRNQFYKTRRKFFFLLSYKKLGTKG